MGPGRFPGPGAPSCREWERERVRGLPAQVHPEWSAVAGKGGTSDSWVRHLPTLSHHGGSRPSPAHSGRLAEGEDGNRSQILPSTLEGLWRRLCTSCLEGRALQDSLRKC